MYNKNNTGNYLRELLLRKNISRPDFCREWAKADNEDPEDKQIIENKNADLSKRINGNIHIQIEEYPVFSGRAGEQLCFFPGIGLYCCGFRYHRAPEDQPKRWKKRG